VEFSKRDVLVLASIAMAFNAKDSDSSSTYKKMIQLPPELSKFKNIYSIISAGDYLDHSVFTVDELTTGIDNLLRGGFIEIDNGFLKPSRKTEDFYEKGVGSRKHIAIRTALNLFKELLNVKK